MKAWGVFKSDGKSLERFRREGQPIEYGIYQDKPNLGGGLKTRKVEIHIKEIKK